MQLSYNLPKLLTFKVYKKTLSSLVIFLAFLFQINQRPAILQVIGELMFVISLIFVFTTLYLEHKFKVTPSKLTYLLLSLLTILYLLFQTFFSKAPLNSSVLVSALLLCLASISILLINSDTWKVVLKALIYPTLVFSGSYLTTLTIVLLTGLNLHDLLISEFIIQQGPEHYKMTIFFPISITIGFGNIYFLDIEFARAVGFLREPGIFQIFVIIAYFGIDYLRVKQKLFWKLSLLLTLFLTFSTAGFACFIASYFYYKIIAQNRDSKLKAFGKGFIALIIIVPITYWFLFTTSKFGLLSKLAFDSGSSRIDRSLEGIQALMENPLFGMGYFHPDLSSITVLGFAGQIGILGMVLLLSIIIIPNIDLIKKKDPKLVFLIPMLLTTFFAQPLIDKPIYFILAALTAAFPRNQNR